MDPPQTKRRVWKLYLRLQIWLFSISMLNFGGGGIQKSAPSCFFCNEHITYGMKIHEPLLLVIGITCRFIPSCSSCSQRKWLKMASPGVARIGLALLIRWSLQKKLTMHPHSAVVHMLAPSPHSTENNLRHQHQRAFQTPKLVVCAAPCSRRKPDRPESPELRPSWTTSYTTEN